ncbi:flippase [uncultured Megasphaera sp.]|uniref:flippase n=1 Tax=uncultured Megasphaera sp. TaxID=165188 RepID=UPI0025EDD96E|nr:flippase [uncultured Megasphaera sp.]
MSSNKEAKQHSLGVNACLNAINSALRIVFPLITYPYVFRILHKDGIGKVTYASSIINYFVLIAGLGIATYAIREGAKIRDDRLKFNLFCNEMFSINIVSTIISYILLAILIVVSSGLQAYTSILLVYSLTIILTTIGVDWINTIYEDFLYITIRSIFSYIISLFLLFLFVRSADDVIPYSFITVIQLAFIAIVNFYYCRKYVHIRIIGRLNLKKHLKPILFIFANSVATTIYVNSDTTMLGILTTDSYVGLYIVSVKIYSVIKTILAAFYSATVPRISYYLGINENEKVKKNFTNIFSAMTIILLPCTVGLAVLSREIILIMGGAEYEEATLTLQILSVSLIGAIFGGLITYALNIPLRREKYNVIATVISAGINIGLNFFMIPLFKQNGAAITTAVSEFFVFSFCFFTLKDQDKYIDFKLWSRNLFQAIIGCFIIAVISFSVKIVISNVLFRVVLIFILSIICYGLILLLFKNQLAYSILNKIKAKI